MYKNILVPVDLSQESSWRRALPAAVAEAKHWGAQLHVVTVVPDLIAGLDWRYAVVPRDYDRDAVVAEARKRLADLIKDQVSAEVPVQHHVKHGTIYEKILDTAREVGADLIMLASHRPTLKDYLLGPNAARVVRHAECSVTIIREDGA
jgi:nucleotide-binding universal stress UspA family protein